MTTIIELSDDLAKAAKCYGEVCSRTVSEQSEYWSQVGKIAEENPDLCYNSIRDIVLTKTELEDGETSIYEFG